LWTCHFVLQVFQT